MNRTQKIIRNSMVGMVARIVAILLSFVSRKVFIQYLGVELLGLKSTFASLLSTFSLAELGFQQVIVFHLYGALAKGDKEQINSLVNIYKLVYRCIGCFFIVAVLCCAPFLQVFLSDIEATGTVRVYFLVQALTGACTYFLAYKRNILYADQNSYISGLIDTVMNTAGTLLSIAVSVLTRNYLLFLLVNLAKTYLSNLFVHIECTKRYPYLHSQKTDWKLLKKVASSLKDVIVERLAVYVYSSTDNLLISAFISTVQVGFLNNYTMIVTHIKTLMESLTMPLVPAIGNMVAVESEHDWQRKTFRVVEQGCFWLTGLAVVPVYVLADDFIRMYLGSEFVLPRLLVALMCMDMYVHINQDSCLSFLTANGLFRKRRNISIGGAAINLAVSALLIKPLGIAGILAGTAVSQFFYWAARSVVAIRECLNQSWRAVAAYWVRQVGLFGIVIASIWISGAVTQRVCFINPVLTFVVNGMICEAIFCSITFICCRGMEAERQMENTLLSVILKRIKKEAT